MNPIPSPYTSFRSLFRLIGHAAPSRHVLLIGMVFLTTRILLHAITEFRIERINDLMQFLDPLVLRYDLGEGIRNMHMQPPLHNLSIGFILKEAPIGLTEPVLAFIYSVLGLTTLLAVYFTMSHLRIRPSVALVLTLCLAVWPPLLLAETLPTYTCPVTTALALSTFAVTRFMKTGMRGYALLFATLVLYIPLTRSLFHIVLWSIPMLALLLWGTWRNHRRMFPLVATMAVGVIAITSIPYLTNASRYGMFTASTWRGMNLMGIVRMIPNEKIERLIIENEVTPLARIRRFSPPEVYYAYYGTRPSTGRPELDQAYRSTGSINYNNEIYVRASRESMRNAIAIMRAYPVDAALGVANQLYLVGGFESYNFFNSPDRWWKPRTESPLLFILDVGRLYLLPLVVLSFIAYSIYSFFAALWRAIRRRRDPITPTAFTVGRLFIGFNIFYVVVAACTELGEGDVFRAPIDPLLTIQFAWVVERFLVRREKLIAGRTPKRVEEPAVVEEL